MPVPPGFVVKNGTKRLFVSEMPGPVSSTVTSTDPPPTVHPTSTLPPASVALARHWNTTRRVGELPPQIGIPVAVSAGEASLILDFCEQHRRLTWRRLSTLSALRLEGYRQKKGALPPMWKHSVPGGAIIELHKDSGPYLRLTDRRDQITRRIPTWLAPATLPVPPSGPSLDYDCPLFGAPPLPELSHN